MKKKKLETEIAVLRSKVVNAGSKACPWFVYDQKVVEDFVKKVLEVE